MTIRKSIHIVQAFYEMTSHKLQHHFF